MLIVAHFVEEQRAAMRLFEPALPGADGAGERAAHVAEDLGFEQVLRDRAAVERDELLPAPRARVMDRARHDFLAGAGFAADQNRARRARDGLERLKQIAHRPTAADDAFEAVALLQLLAQPGVLRLQPPLLDGAVECVTQFVELEWLGHEVGGAALDHLDGVADRAVAGDHDADDLRVPVDRGLDDRRPVDAWQAQVGDDDVEGELGQRFERHLAAFGLHDLVSVIRQALGNRHSQRRFVFDQQQMFRSISHLWERRHFDVNG